MEIIWDTAGGDRTNTIPLFGIIVPSVVYGQSVRGFDGGYGRYHRVEEVYAIYWTDPHLHQQEKAGNGNGGTSLKYSMKELGTSQMDKRKAFGIPS